MTDSAAAPPSGRRSGRRRPHRPRSRSATATCTPARPTSPRSGAAASSWHRGGLLRQPRRHRHARQRLPALPPRHRDGIPRAPRRCRGGAHRRRRADLRGVGGHEPERVDDERRGSGVTWHAAHGTNGEPYVAFTTAGGTVTPFGGPTQPVDRAPRVRRRRHRRPDGLLPRDGAYGEPLRLPPNNLYSYDYGGTTGRSARRLRRRRRDVYEHEPHANELRRRHDLRIDGTEVDDLGYTAACSTTASASTNTRPARATERSPCRRA